VSFTKKPLVGIIMGSSSDSRIMHEAAKILDEFQVKHEDQIIWNCNCQFIGGKLA